MWKCFTEFGYFFDFEFDGRRDASERIGFRYGVYDENDEVDWSDWYYGSSSLTHLNEDGTLPLLLGKFLDTSTTGTNATFGEVFLYTIPEPTSAALLLIGSTLVLRRRRPARATR